MSLLLLYSQPATQIVEPETIESSSLVSDPQLNLTIYLDTLASSASVGIPQLILSQIISDVGGIPSTAEVGEPVLNFSVSVTNVGGITGQSSVGIPLIGLITSTPRFIDVTFKAQGKGGYLVGDSEVSFVDASDSSKVELGTGDQSIIGNVHNFSAFQPSPESWQRYRSYQSFYSSGSGAFGYLEKAALRFYVNEAYSQLTVGANPIVFDSNWDIEIWTVSGNVQQPYSTSYGFGDDLDYDDWGSYPPSEINIFSRKISNSNFNILAVQPGGTNTFDSTGKITKFQNKWIEIEIPIEYVNKVGESHFRITHGGESSGISPPLSNSLSNEYLGYRNHLFGDVSFLPELVLSYVTSAGTFPINPLRITDLSLNRFIQNKLNQDILYSGTSILDAYPEDFTKITRPRTISLEHIQSTDTQIELGTDNRALVRTFMIDILCKNRGDSLDLSDKVVNYMENKRLPVYDFRVGLFNPPEIGKMQFTNLQVFDLHNDEATANNYSHVSILASCEVLISGFNYLF